MSAACPLCRSEAETLATEAVSVTSESKVLGVASELAVCRGCGHLFTSLALDARRYYEESYDSTLTDDGMDEIVTMKDGSVRFRTDIDFGVFFEKVMLNRHLGTSIFELGAGHGRVLSRLAKRGFTDLTAFELGGRYRASLARIVGDDRVFIQERPTGRTYDVIASFFVLEHDVDPRGSLAYMRSISAPGGTLYLVVPSFRSNAIDLACADHHHHFSGELFARLVACAGFEVVEVDETSCVGAVIVTARNDGAAPRELLASPDAHAIARASAGDYLALRQRIAALPAAIPAESKLYLYGAGFYAALVSAALGGRPIEGLFDANPRKHGLSRLGQTVRDPADIAREDFSDGSLLVCVNGAIAGAIRDRYAGRFGNVACL